MLPVSLPPPLGRASGGSVRFVGMVSEVEKVGPWSSGMKTGGWRVRGTIGSSAMPASSAIQRAARRVHGFAGRTRSSSLGGGGWSPALSASRVALSQASRARYLSLGGTSRSAMAFAGSPGGSRVSLWISFAASFLAQIVRGSRWASDRRASVGVGRMQPVISRAQAFCSASRLCLTEGAACVRWTAAP